MDIPCSTSPSLLECLLARVRKMAIGDDTPILLVGIGVMSRRCDHHLVPLSRQRNRIWRTAAGQRHQDHLILRNKVQRPHAPHRRRRQLQARLLIRPELQRHFPNRPILAFVRDRIVRLKQLHNDVGRFAHHRVQVLSRDAETLWVSW